MTLNGSYDCKYCLGPGKFEYGIWMKGFHQCVNVALLASHKALLINASIAPRSIIEPLLKNHLPATYHRTVKSGRHRRRPTYVGYSLESGRWPAPLTSPFCAKSGNQSVSR